MMPSHQNVPNLSNVTQMKMSILINTTDVIMKYETFEDDSSCVSLTLIRQIIPILCRSAEWKIIHYFFEYIF